jgi:hypothetical protein
MSELGIVADAVRGDVPLPLTYPVRVTAPVPPRLTGIGNVVGRPARVAAMIWLKLILTDVPD